MRQLTFVVLFAAAILMTRAWSADLADAAALVKAKPLPTPSDSKFNSVVTKTPPVLAGAGTALTADGTGKTLWAKIKGTNVDSGTASNGMVLTADGSGAATWTGGSGGTISGNLVGNVTGNVSGTAANVTGIVAIANGGTGSAVQNFVDLTTNQTVAGNKTFTGTFNASTAFVVEARPNNTPPISPNTFIGTGAGAGNTVGQANVFIGNQAGTINSTGNNNIFIGQQAGAANTGGFNNCFVGLSAGQSNAGGSANNFFGGAAGAFNTSGTNNNYFGISAGAAGQGVSNNTFLGHQAGMNNTTSNNTFVGANAGVKNTSGVANVFVGSGAGSTCTTGQQNSFFGINAGSKTDGLASGNPSTGSHNTGFGAGSCQNNTIGDGNTAIGNVSGFNNTTGSNNAFLGGNTGSSNTVESHNTFVGDSSTGAGGITYATAVGANAQVTQSNSLVLGAINGVNSAASDTLVGIGVTAPNSYLQVNGSVAVGFRKTANQITILGQQDCVFVFTGGTANSGANLPDAFGITGRILYIKNKGTVTYLLYTVGNQTIDGTNYYTVPLSITTGTVVQVISDGANWYKIN